jgi:hypothetical protein
MVLAAVSAFVVTNYDNFVPMSVLAKAVNRNSFGMDAVEMFAARTIAPVNVPIPFGYVIGVLIIGGAAIFALSKHSRTSTDLVERSLIAGGFVFGAYLLAFGAWTWTWYYVFNWYVATFLLALASVSVANRFRAAAVVPLVILIGLMLWSGADFGNARRETRE